MKMAKSQQNSEALAEVYRVAKWSFECLLRGRFPHHDHNGHCWKHGTWRARQAGSPLDVSGRDCRACLAELMGDWKWLKECLGLSRHYGCNLCCHLCRAEKHSAPYAYDFSLIPGWLSTMITHDTWRLEFGTLPWLAQIPGFSLLMVIPDPMHMLHLGVLLVTVGTVLALLLERNVFGVFHGCRQAKLYAGLRAAYVQFRKFTRRHRITQSQTRFTVGMLGMHKAKHYPEMKAKAHNSAVLLQWVNFELRKDPSASLLEKSCVESLAGLIALQHKRGPFEAGEAHLYVQYGRAYLRSYASLASRARAANIKKWPLRPKHHQVSHLMLEVEATGVKPAWCFADEDYNRVTIRTLRSAPSMKGIEGRTVFAAIFKLWRSLNV